MTTTATTETEMVQRTAEYADEVLTKVEALPVVFAQRRTKSWFGRLTMPGIRPLTRLFVNRQLGTNLRRCEAELGLDELASGSDDRTSAEIGKLAAAVGAKSSKLIPIAIILGTVGITVSLLSIVVPRLQEEARLLGAVPRIVSLDGADLARHATSFDDNQNAFSPADLEGVFTAVLLAGIVIFVLFAVLAGSSHTAAAILKDPENYSPSSTAFLPAARRGSISTQREVLGLYPAKLYAPIAMDLVRDAAFYFVVLLAFVSRRLDGFAAENRSFLKIERVGGVEMWWAFTLLLFPGAILTAYLVLRHRHRSEDDSTDPPAWWRVTIGALLALLAGGALLWTLLLGSGARITQGPDLSLRRSDGFITVEDTARLEAIEGVELQTLSYYYEFIETESGPVEVTLLVTELDQIHSLVSVDETELEIARLRAADPDFREEAYLQAYVSDGLRERLDSVSDDVNLYVDEGEESLPLGFATVTFPYDSEELVVIVDVQNYLEIDDLLIDDVLVRSVDGPLRDGSREIEEVKAVASDLDLEIFDLRRERVTDRSLLIPSALLLLASGYGAIHIAFGPPWRLQRRNDTEPSSQVSPPPSG